MANITLFDPMTTQLNKFLQSWLPREWPLEKEFGSDMKIDLSEDEKHYTVRADLPGVKKEDIQVEVDGNRVAIGAQMKSFKEEKKGETVIHCERYEGKVFRSFSLGSDVDDSKAEASYKDGVLELRLPKKSNGKSKRLSIN
ncbi:MAG TPA: Hsp20/alpha crystallin family protein [Spongiibacteraceae bacterium]|nr:Hsp20/alpha crystallin family protein [Spongiibacteraceae bacterium]